MTGRISNRLTFTSFPYSLCFFSINPHINTNQAINCRKKSHCNVPSGSATLHDRIPGELAQRAVGIFLKAISIPGWLVILISTQKHCITHNHIPWNSNQCVCSSAFHYCIPKCLWPFQRDMTKGKSIRGNVRMERNSGPNWLWLKYLWQILLKYMTMWDHF